MKSHLSLTLHSCSDNCSLPRRWVQEIKCMHPVLLTHGLFFNLHVNTKQCYSQITHNNTYIYTDIHIQWFFWAPHSLLPVLALTCPLLCDWTPLFTWRTSFFSSWCEYPSILVPGLLSTVLPLLLHPPQGTPQIKLHIYIDNISNIGRPIRHNNSTLTFAFRITD